MYELLKLLHIVGVIVLIGNVTVTAFWKVFADLSGDVRLIAHAQRGVTVTEWLFTLPAIILLLVGGYGMVITTGMDLRLPWLLAGQAMFAVSGVIWLGVLVPLQIRQARHARGLTVDAPIDDDYRRACRSWLRWGIAATVPLIAAVYVMIVR